MTIPVNEQETTIGYTRDGDAATVYTSDKTVMTRLDKLAYDPTSPWICYKQDYNGEDLIAKWYKAPKSLISFRCAKVTRQLTDEQRAAMAERLHPSQSESEF